MHFHPVHIERGNVIIVVLVGYIRMLGFFYHFYFYRQENTRDKLSINKINWFGRILRKLNIPKKDQYQRYPISCNKVEIIYFTIEEYEGNALILFYATITNNLFIINKLPHE